MCGVCVCLGLVFVISMYVYECVCVCCQLILTWFTDWSLLACLLFAVDVVVVGWQLIFHFHKFFFSFSFFFLFDKTFSLISQRVVVILLCAALLCWSPLLVPSTFLIALASQMSALATAIASL